MNRIRIITVTLALVLVLSGCSNFDFLSKDNNSYKAQISVSDGKKDKDSNKESETTNETLDSILEKDNIQDTSDATEKQLLNYMTSIHSEIEIIDDEVYSLIEDEIVNNEEYKNNQYEAFHYRYLAALFNTLLEDAINVDEFLEKYKTFMTMSSLELDYDSFELYYENEFVNNFMTNNDFIEKNELMLELYNQVANNDDYSKLSDFLFYLSNDLESSVKDPYLITDNSLEINEKSYIVVIHGDDLRVNQAGEFDESKAKEELDAMFVKDNIAQSMELEENCVYYLASFNKYMKLSDIQVVYTFDGDYKQFVYGLDSKEEFSALTESDYYDVFRDELTIEYLEEIDDDTLGSYEDLIHNVLHKYDKIVEPIMMYSQVGHYIYRYDGKYATTVEGMLTPSMEYGSISFYIVDSIEAQYFSVGGLSTPVGILLPIHTLGSDAENTIHHELMHQIELYSSVYFRYNIKLKKGDFDYIDSRGLTPTEYKQALQSERVTSLDSFDLIEYGMTSTYSGVNQSEHLAELWSTMVTNYDMFEDQIEDNPKLEQNLEILLRYMNDILKKIDGQPLENYSDIQRFKL